MAEEFFSIDRIEGDFAVIETPDNKHKNIALENLPQGVQSGDVLKKNGNGDFEISKSETEKRRNVNINLLEKLRKKSKGIS